MQKKQSSKEFKTQQKLYIKYEYTIIFRIFERYKKQTLLLTSKI